MLVRILAGLVIVAMVGCGSKTDQLTRDQAKEIISQRLAETPTKSPVLCKLGIERGVELGLWGTRTATNGPPITMPGGLTEKGRQYIEGTYGGSGFAYYENHWFLDQLRVPLKRTVRDVTGIASTGAGGAGDASSLKLVEFDWTYVDAPSEIASVISKGSKATVPLRLFDDGWRVALDETQLDRAIFDTHLKTASEECLK